VLWATPPWLELVADDELPKDFDDPHARSKELAEERCLLQLLPHATRCPVLDVPGNVYEVRQLLVGFDQVNGLIIVHHGDVGVVVVRHGGGGGKDCAGGCEMWMCVCVLCSVGLTLCHGKRLSSWYLFGTCSYVWSL
jgi:hypothetical protein